MFLFYTLPNLYYWRRAEKLRSAYKRYTSEEIDTEEQFLFIEKKQEAISLFKQAGVPDSTFTKTIMVDHKYIQHVSVSVFENLDILDREIIPKVIRCFSYAIGVYKKRASDSTNPIRWIEAIKKFLSKNPIFQLVPYLLKFLKSGN